MVNDDDKETKALRETAIDLHVGVMALVCGGRTYVQKVSVTKKVSKNINRRKVSNDDGQNMKSVYHSKQNYRISLDNSRLLWDFGSFLVRLLILFRNFLDRRVFQGAEPRAMGDHQFPRKNRLASAL